MDLGNLAALLSLPVSLASLGIAIWKGFTAKRAADTASRQADQAQRTADMTEKSLQLSMQSVKNQDRAEKSERVRQLAIATSHLSDLAQDLSVFVHWHQDGKVSELSKSRADQLEEFHQSIKEWRNKVLDAAGCLGPDPSLIDKLDRPSDELSELYTVCAYELIKLPDDVEVEEVDAVKGRLCESLQLLEEHLQELMLAMDLERYGSA